MPIYISLNILNFFNEIGIKFFSYACAFFRIFLYFTYIHFINTKNKITAY